MKNQPVDHYRKLSLLQWLAGSAWLLAGAVSLLRDEPTHALDVWLIVPLALTFLILGRFANAYWRSLPRYGRTGAGLVLAAALPTAIGQVAAVAEWDSLTWLGFPTGVLLFAAGSALLGAALARHGIRPRWIGYAIATAQPAAMLTGLALSPIRELSDYGSYTGALAHGVIWLAIAWTLTKKENAPSPGQLRSAGTLAD